MKRFTALILVLCLCIGLCACGKPQEAVEAENLISAIGEVTITSGEAITLARDYYEALPTEVQEKVENADILQQAIKTYEDLIHYDITMEKYILSLRDEDGEIVTYSDQVFNDAGLMIARTCATGSTSSVDQYEYDQAGRLIKEWSDLGSFHTQTDYIYDADGLLIKETRTSNLPGVITYVDEYTNVVDRQGRIVRKSTVSSRSDNIGIDEYTYDNGGLLALDKYYIEGNNSFYFLTTYRYDVYGNLVLEDVKSNNGQYAWSVKYQYEAYSDYVISSRTDPSLKTKDQWDGFEDRPDLPKPDDVLTTAEQYKAEKSSAYSLYATYVVSNTADCGKYLNTLAQECGFDIQFLDESCMIIGRIMDNGNPVAEFVLQTEDDLGVVFILAFPNA